MNWIDIIFVLIFALAIFRGFKDGVIKQICSVLGVIFGIWLGIRYGSQVGEMLGVSSDFAFAAGLAVVVIATLIAVSIVAFIFKKLFKIVGLSVLDSIFGAILSVCKYALIISVLLGVFATFNTNLKIIDDNTISQSKLYKPLLNVSDTLFPALDWTKEQINSGLEKLQ